MKRLLLLGALSAVALIPVVQSSAAPEKTITLKGTVGPGFTIVLKNAAGQKVKTLKAGMYKFTVTDKSPIHNFVVENKNGKFEKEITEVSKTGTVSKTITLTKGKWKVYCEPHEAQMHQDFSVT